MLVSAYERLARTKTSLLNNDKTKDILTAMGITMDTDNMDAFWGIINSFGPDMLAKNAAIQEQLTKNGYDTDSFLSAVFGKGYSEMKPLIADVEGFLGKVEAAKTGNLVMDEETVNAFADLNDIRTNIQMLQTAAWQGVAAYFLGDTTTLATDVQTLMTALNNVVHGEGGIGDIETAVETLAQDAADAVANAVTAINTVITTLQNSENEDVKAVGDAFAGIRDAIKSIIDNKDTIVTGFQVILGVFATVKLATGIRKVASAFTSIANAIKIINGGGTAAASAITAMMNAQNGTPSTGGNGKVTSKSPAVIAAAKLFAGLAAGATVLTQGIWDESLQAGAADSMTGMMATEWDAQKFAAYMKTNNLSLQDMRGWLTYLNDNENDPYASAVLAKLQDESYLSVINDAIQTALETSSPEGGFEVPMEADPTLREQVESQFTNPMQIPFFFAAPDGSGGAYGTQTMDHGGGSGNHFAVGTSYIPYDNYLAYLHKGESVLTAVQAQKWRAGQIGGGGGLSSGQLRQVMGMFTEALGNVSVQMSGQAVGTLVAPAVSEEIARQIGRI